MKLNAKKKNYAVDFPINYVKTSSYFNMWMQLKFTTNINIYNQMVMHKNTKINENNITRTHDFGKWLRLNAMSYNAIHSFIKYVIFFENSTTCAWN